MTPQQYSHQICKKSGSSFFYSFYLLPKEKRNALEAFYAFCRLADDAVDLAPNPKEAKEDLQFWKEEIDHLYQGKFRHPVTRALSPAVKNYQIPRIYFDEIILGCEMDLEKKNYADFKELETYCYRVASCVGLVCLHIFGVERTKKTMEAGASLGKALQLTNILRDIATDLQRGRIYLPQEDLQKFGVSAKDLSEGFRKNVHLLELLDFEIGRTRHFYKEAWQNFPKENNEIRKLLPARLMGRFYEHLLDQISRDPIIVFEKKVCLSLMEKIEIAFKEICSGFIKKPI